jgi:hypothetical protein
MRWAGHVAWMGKPVEKWLLRRWRRRWVGIIKKYVGVVQVP